MSAVTVGAQQVMREHRRDIRRHFGWVFGFPVVGQGWNKGQGVL